MRLVEADAFSLPGLSRAKSKTDFQPLWEKCRAFALFSAQSADVTLVLLQLCEMSLASPVPRTSLELLARMITTW